MNQAPLEDKLSKGEWTQKKSSRARLNPAVRRQEQSFLITALDTTLTDERAK